MQLRLLGGMELTAGDEVVGIGGRKERVLLAVLAVHAGHEVDQARLVEALWDDAPPRTATRSLQVHVSRLRATLATAGPAITVETRQRGYALHAEPGSFDTHEMTERATTARQCAAAGRHGDAVAAFDAALALWRGRSLGDLAGERYLRAEAARLDELRVALCEERIESLLALGRHGGTIGEIEALCTEHPFRERLVGHRMLALYRADRQKEALTVYQDLRVRLRDELGLDPSPSLAELERAILNHDEALRLDQGSEDPAPVEQSDKLRVMLVDDHPMWRQAVRILLERDGDVVVVAEASDGDAAVAAAIGADPAIVLMDLHLPGVGGVEATRRIVAEAPNTRVLVLSASDDGADVREALRAGAHGYIVKTGTARDVVDAVRRVDAGEPVFSPSVAPLVLTELRRPETA